jgi:hypothetical protein
MTDHICIGPTPAAETCAQVGAADYHRKARRECVAFINQIRRELGPEPDGARLFIKSNPHDFGSYLEVCCEYEVPQDNRSAAVSDPEYFPAVDRAALDYALRCESTADRWDDEAIKELDALAASARRLV